MFLLRKGFYSAVRKKEKTHREKDPRHLRRECGGAETGITGICIGKESGKVQTDRLPAVPVSAIIRSDMRCGSPAVCT